MSDIYGSLYQTLQPSRYAVKRKEGPETPNATLIGLGLAWETHLEKVLVQAGINAQRPGEFRTKEGIIFSPDLLIDNGVTRLGEIKLTRYAMTGDYRDERFAKWMTQCKAYCYHLETPYATLLALHVGGNYREVRDPTLVITELEFTPRELRDEWERLLRHAQEQRML